MLCHTFVRHRIVHTSVRADIAVTRSLLVISPWIYGHNNHKTGRRCVNEETLKDTHSMS